MDGPVMQAEVHAAPELHLARFIEQVSGATDEAAARRLFRDGFHRLRANWSLYPGSEGRPSVVFESAAATAKMLATQCLPLGIAVAMHLYPLCALQCVPMPVLSPARFKRAMLLRAVRQRALILANAGSERAQGVDEPLIATRTADGLRIDGTYEYMSLASVADIVFFKATLASGEGTVLCAADLKADSVRIGSWRFGGSMRLSDTSSVSFVNHPVSDGRYLLMQDGTGLRCVSDYQRCWFHLFLADIYLARLVHLHRIRGLPPSAAHVVTLNEVAHLRDYSLCLLDDVGTDSDMAALVRATGALKLRVSLLAQSTAAALRGRADVQGAQAKQLEADARELGYIKHQPTADEKILHDLGAAGSA
jgi:hypothetical protein